jgi:tetratricopeptide (TPR) repeat protein
VLNVQGYLQMVARNQDAAIATLDESRAAYRSIADLALSDPSAAAGYAEATAWQVAANADRGDVDGAVRGADEVIAVTGRILEKRPGHMQALRAQALATSPLSSALKSDMRLAEALAAVETTERAWREFVRLDPGNTISWSNLGVAYINKGFILEAMGRLGDAAAASRAALELDHQAPPNTLLRTNLMIHAGRLAVLETLRGNRPQAEEALVISERFRAWTVERLPAGSYERSARDAAAGFWRTVVAYLSGDYRRAIEVGRGSAAKLEPLDAPGDAGRYDKARWLSWIYTPVADSAYAVGDFETAERAILRSLEIRKAIPALAVEPDELRETAYEQAIAALVLERRGKHDEAVKLIDKTLKFERGLAARNRDDAGQRFELAVALFVAAAVGVGDRSAQLAEASALLDKLPLEFQRARNVIVLRERIAEEKSRGRGG